MVIGSNSSWLKEPEQLLLHWIPRNSPISWPPALQALTPKIRCCPSSRMDFPLTCPTSSPSCHLTSDSQGSYWKRLGREENQPWRRDERQMLLCSLRAMKPSTQQTPSARLALSMRLICIRSWNPPSSPVRQLADYPILQMRN